MNVSGFHQPLNEKHSPSSAKGVSDFMTEFKDWWIKVPLITKVFFYFSLIMYTLSLIKWTLPYMLCNIPVFTFSDFELYRILFAPMINLKLSEFILGFFLFLPMGHEKELRMGSIHFFLDFLIKNTLVQILFTISLFSLGFAADYFWTSTSSGVLNYYIIYLTARCVESPNEPTMILCLPIQIKAKLYPFVLIVFFSVLVGPRFDLLISVLFGFLDHKFLQNKIAIKKNYIIAIEASDYMTFARNLPSYVSILKIPTDVENPQNMQEFKGMGQELGTSSKNQHQSTVENLNDLSVPKETKLNISQDKFVELNED